MVGVGPLQPLACAIFSGGLPWAGKLARNTGRSYIQVIVQFFVGLERLAVEKIKKNSAATTLKLAMFLHTRQIMLSIYSRDDPTLSTHVMCTLTPFNCRHFQSYSIGSINDRCMQRGDLYTRVPQLASLLQGLPMPRPIQSWPGWVT